MVALLVVLLGLGLLVLNEWMCRHYGRTNEFSRKFVHLVVGSFVATWPYFMTWNEIRLISLAALIVVTISKYFNLFRAIHTVTRPTWGEAYFALTVGLTTFVTQQPAIYAVAVLQMSLADGLAAVVGTRYGKGNDYVVLGSRKSLVGSATFLVVSYVLLLALAVFSVHIPIAWCVVVAVAATVLENLGLRGLDNLLVPLFVALALRLLI